MINGNRTDLIRIAGKYASGVLETVWRNIELSAVNGEKVCRTNMPKGVGSRSQAEGLKAYLSICDQIKHNQSVENGRTPQIPYIPNHCFEAGKHSLEIRGKGLIRNLYQNRQTFSQYI